MGSMYGSSEEYEAFRWNTLKVRADNAPRMSDTDFRDSQENLRHNNSSVFYGITVVSFCLLKPETDPQLYSSANILFNQQSNMILILETETAPKKIAISLFYALPVLCLTLILQKAFDVRHRLTSTISKCVHVRIPTFSISYSYANFQY